MFEYEWSSALENFDDSELRKSGEVKGVKLSLSYLGSAPLLWVVESPVLVRARLCSPCVPNAGDLDCLDPDGGVECYGLPEHWLDDEGV